MNRIYRGKFLFLQLSVLVAMIGIWSCDDYGDVQATDILQGNVDIEAEYAKTHMDYPVHVYGTITNRSTGEIIAGAKVTARVDIAETKYTTTSKKDGTFSLYVEGHKDYVITAEKDGFDKSYVKGYNSSDTIVSVDNNEFNSNIKLVVHDNTPAFKVNYQASKYVDYTLYDLGYNGSYVVGEYYSYMYYFQDGTYMKYSYAPQSYDFFGCQDTVFWMGNKNSKTLSKIGQKSGKLITTVYAQIPSTSLVDLDILNNNFYLISSSQISKLSSTGALQTTFDVKSKIAETNLVGIAHTTTHLFVLNKETNAENTNPGYTLYKVDPATGDILSKGYLPDNLDALTLRGLATDGKNFWTYSYDYYNSSLVKFTITE